MNRLLTSLVLFLLVTSLYGQGAEYFSANSSFSIKIPKEYTLYKEPLPNAIFFSSTKEHGSISIRRVFHMASSDFQNLIMEDKSKMTKKFRSKTISESDHFCHYKYMSGLFVTHKYYMRKVIEGYDYVVFADGISLSEEDAILIINSVKAY